MGKKKSRNKTPKKRVPYGIVCMLKTDIHDHLLYRIKLQCFRELINALGYTILKTVIQTRKYPKSSTLFGKGKVEEIRQLVKDLDIDTVFVYNTLSSSQKHNLTRAFGCEVLDRYEVTLKIFEINAADTLSKLQIKLAILEKLAPYIKLQASLRYKKERAFFRSMGEYAYHKKLAMLKKSIKIVKQKIEKHYKRRLIELQRRKESGIPILCASGFFNAGKTTFFNALTGLDKPVSSMPFTTLSSKYSRLILPSKIETLLIDTIGFVIDLDPQLIHSFKINVLDIKMADLILFFLDVNDSLETLTIKVDEGMSILKEIRGKYPDNLIVVLNKIDQVTPQIVEKKRKFISEMVPFEIVPISARTGDGLDELIYVIDKEVREIFAA
ncbi:hypothetical protein DRO02_01080 [archaeon]|nr:MAG: hypothetical protein DRO02_01080 [archaeon]RLG66033.1 MAG: hypothetical protein DRO21_00560 [archaeon]HDM23785.1 HflX family GTPase [Candidatus Bathyarchaeota archaeon]